MNEKLWGLLGYVTFFPTVYFALVEPPDHPIRRETDPALWEWVRLLSVWLVARIVVWGIWMVLPWDIFSLIPSLVLLIGWIRLVMRGIQVFMT